MKSISNQCNLIPIYINYFFFFLVHTHAWYDESNPRRFPDDFVFGASTASYQIEGGWNLDGKGENIWDHLTHRQPSPIADGSNGDVAADSYHNYRRDVEMMRELGIDAYRFSFSWTRILPNGFANEINRAGIDFYNNYINEMLKYNITPMATMYHWDMPQVLQELGGFANPLFAEWFGDYSRVLYEKFGDRVKLWITFNEPKQICLSGYGTGRSAPMINSAGIGHYLCIKTLIMAHANAYHLYNIEYRHSQAGQIGYAVDVQWISSLTDSVEDVRAAEMKRQSEWGHYSDPIFSAEGGWPKEFAARVAAKSASQGFPRSRLPEFTDEESAFARGTADFFAINHYSSHKAFAQQNTEEHPVPSLYDDISDVGTYTPEEWTTTLYGNVSTNMAIAPDSFFSVITQLHQRYNNTVFYITESGIGTASGLEDNIRVFAYRNNLRSVLNAVEADLPIKGFMVWSLMDNFEWMKGYKLRFGLYQVDFTDPARTRTPKKSAFIYKQIVKSRTIDQDYEPENRIMTID